MTTILIVDDHPLVSDGIASMLNGYDYLHIVNSCKTGQEALELLKKEKPDVILLDINLPDINGLELCSIIKKQKINTKVIILTSINEAAIISQTLSQGADGYLLKNMEKIELLDAIDSVMSNKMYVSHSANEKLLENYSSLKDAASQAIVLTRREKEILNLLNNGMNGPQIATTLYISSYTVESHRKNLMQKLKTSTTQMLLKKASELKMI